MASLHRSPLTIFLFLFRSSSNHHNLKYSVYWFSCIIKAYENLYFSRSNLTAMLLILLFIVVMEWIISWTDMMLSRLFTYYQKKKIWAIPTFLNYHRTKVETHLKRWIKSPRDIWFVIICFWYDVHYDNMILRFLFYFIFSNIIIILNYKIYYIILISSLS